MVVARLQSALAGYGERRWLRTAATEARVARWEPMGGGGGSTTTTGGPSMATSHTRPSSSTPPAPSSPPPSPWTSRIPTPQSSSPNLTNFFGNFPMKTLWLAVYIADAILFVVFYYKGDQDKSMGKRLRTTLMWVVASAVVCGLILSILYGGNLGFYYKDHEILPPLPVVFHRYIVENFNDASSDNLTELEVEEFDPPSEVRAITEGQMLPMRGYAERFGMPNLPKWIIATGGASSNKSILKSIAQIFGYSVFTVQRPVTTKLPHYSC